VERELTAREAKFVAHYSVNFNGAAAYRAAYGENPNARFYAHDLLTKPHIQKLVENKRKELGELHFDLANKAMAQLNRMLEANERRSELFSADGSLLPPDQWPEDMKLLIAGIEISENFDKDGTVIGFLKKVKMETPKGIVDSVLKATGKFVERTQLLDKHGRPTDPASAQPIINMTVGKPPEREKRK
jgi:phage terminase small subunit